MRDARPARAGTAHPLPALEDHQGPAAARAPSFEPFPRATTWAGKGFRHGNVVRSLHSNWPGNDAPPVVEGLLGGSVAALALAAGRHPSQAQGTPAAPTDAITRSKPYVLTSEDDTVGSPPVRFLGQLTPCSPRSPAPTPRRPRRDRRRAHPDSPSAPRLAGRLPFGSLVSTCLYARTDPAADGLHHQRRRRCPRSTCSPSAQHRLRDLCRAHDACRPAKVRDRNPSTARCRTTRSSPLEGIASLVMH